MRQGPRHHRNTAAAERLERRQLLSTSMQAYPAHLDVTASPAFTTGSNGPYGLSPSQIRGAYGIDAVRFNGVVGDGTGQTIAIIVAYDDPAFVSSTSAGFASSDLHRFDQQFGLADPPSFTKVGQTGSATNLPGTDPTGVWADETALDVEWAHVSAPNANILLVECNSDGLDDLINSTSGGGEGGANYARQQPGVSVVSMSFAASESASELGYDPYLVTPAGHQGVTFVAASGDGGSGATYPAASPSVIGVGGTTASLAGDIYSSETALSNGGGGVSAYESKPAFQAGLTQSGTRRLVPDVAFAANHFTNGFDVYDSYNGGAGAPWYSVGGTSVAAPIWAGLIAMADQGRARLGLKTLNAAASTMPRLYDLNPSDFHDVTTGSNGNAAGTGYDLVTGRGTPIANLLVPDLAGGASISGNIYADANANGTRDAGEVGIGAALVYLDLSSTGSPGGIDPTTYTGANGAFSFSDLPGGTYRLTALPYTSYVPSSATYYTVTVGYNSSVSGKLFGQRYITGTISGHMFEDLHLSTTRTNDDPPFGFLPVYLDNNNDGVYDAGDVQTFTDVHGYYQFAGLGLGAAYHVRQDSPAGLSRTTAAGGPGTSVTLLTTSYTLDIGYVPNTGSISGNVFEDDNGNNIRDAGEHPIYGTALYLDLDHNGDYTAGLDPYVLTAPDGSYTISGLAPGTYRITQVIPLGYRRNRRRDRRLQRRRRRRRGGDERQLRRPIGLKGGSAERRVQSAEWACALTLRSALCVLHLPA